MIFDCPLVMYKNIKGIRQVSINGVNTFEWINVKLRAKPLCVWSLLPMYMKALNTIAASSCVSYKTCKTSFLVFNHIFLPPSKYLRIGQPPSLYPPEPFCTHIWSKVPHACTFRVRTASGWLIYSVAYRFSYIYPAPHLSLFATWSLQIYSSTEKLFPVI